MHLRASFVAIAMTLWVVAPTTSALAQDSKVDIRKVTCVELDKVENEDRIATIFFFYGFHAALLTAYEVSPASLEKNVRNVVEFCRDNPTTPIFEAMPKAFQR